MIGLPALSERPLWLALLGAAALLAALSAFDPTIGVGVAVGGLGLVALGYFAARPWQVFGLFLFVLPLHILGMTLLLVQIGLPAGTVKLISAWKELALFGMVGLAGWRALRFRVRLVLPDGIVALYGLWAIFVFLVSLPGHPDRTALFYGLRDALLPFLLYGVGRLFPLTEGRATRLFRWLLWAALLFAVAGIIERFLIPTQWHVEFGIPQYYARLLGLRYGAETLGLPENYWTSYNSGHIRRAVSVYTSSQPFALSFLLLLPPALFQVLQPERRRTLFATLTVALSLVALFLTLTRFTIVIALGLLAVAAIITNRRALRLLGMTLVVTVVLAAGVVVVNPRVRLLVINTVTFQDHSSSLRLSIWGETAQVALRRPFGYGIGTVGQTANRFLARQARVVAIEGQVSKLLIELGLPGLALYLAALGTLASRLMRAFYLLPSRSLRGLCFASSLTLMGILVNAITTELHNSPALIYPTWWLVGACIAATTTLAARPAVAPASAESGSDG